MLHLERDGVEGFLALGFEGVVAPVDPLPDTHRILADDLVDNFPAEVVAEHRGLVRLLGRGLEFVEKHVEVLVHVHLLSHVDGVPLIVDVRLAEVPGVVELFVALLEVGEHSLHLVHEAFRHVRLRYRHLQNRATKLGDVEELLVERVHVARRAKVLQPHIPRRGLLKLRRPIRGQLAELALVVLQQEKPHQVFVVVWAGLHERVEELQREVSRLSRLALSALLVRGVLALERRHLEQALQHEIRHQPHIVLSPQRAPQPWPLVGERAQEGQAPDQDRVLPRQRTVLDCWKVFDLFPEREGDRVEEGSDHGLEVPRRIDPLLFGHRFRQALGLGQQVVRELHKMFARDRPRLKLQHQLQRFLQKVDQRVEAGPPRVLGFRGVEGVHGFRALVDGDV
mmetsp:Transcript_4806/g.11560  ORF Transcript_4806/g.11560 Transcript_4806/m.11560 type:complete len:396 (+) Transcript_4806:462-1649(+)